MTSTLKDFEIIKDVGKGSFATVSIVKRKLDDKIYAMKRVKIGTMATKEKENALNEVRLLASVTSKQVIGYKEAFLDEETQTLNIIMEYADDEDLDKKIKTRLKNNYPFKEDEIWFFTIQIIKGIKSLHDKNIMHRDLKSANIFLTKDGGVKIGDLNVSKLIKDKLAHTQTGTPYYASPEVWADISYDYKADIWSVGCIVYEMCCLRTPFKAKGLSELFEVVSKGKYSPIPEYYSKELSDLISKLLTVNPVDRISCDEILELDYIKEKIAFFKDNKKLKESSKKNKEESIMLSTIKFSNNLNDIQLPKKTGYYDEFSETGSSLIKSMNDSKFESKISKGSNEQKSEKSDIFDGIPYKEVRNVLEDDSGKKVYTKVGSGRSIKNDEVVSTYKPTIKTPVKEKSQLSSNSNVKMTKNKSTDNMISSSNIGNSNAKLITPTKKIISSSITQPKSIQVNQASSGTLTPKIEPNKTPQNKSTRNDKVITSGNSKDFISSNITIEIKKGVEDLRSKTPQEVKAKLGIKTPNKNEKLIDLNQKSLINKISAYSQKAIGDKKPFINKPSTLSSSNFDNKSQKSSGSTKNKDSNKIVNAKNIINKLNNNKNNGLIANNNNYYNKQQKPLNTMTSTNESYIQYPQTISIQSQPMSNYSKQINLTSDRGCILSNMQNVNLNTNYQNYLNNNNQVTKDRCNSGQYQKSNYSVNNVSNYSENRYYMNNNSQINTNNTSYTNSQPSTPGIIKGIIKANNVYSPSLNTDTSQNHQHISINNASKYSGNSLNLVNKSGIKSLKYSGK